MKSYKIYKYTNLITGMCYVGQTCRTLEIRAGRNMTGYRGCDKFWEAIEAYGTDCWRDEILWDGLTLEEANIYEQLEIRDNETLYPYGYNLDEGGLGGSPSRETRQKLSVSLKHSPSAIKHRQNLAQRPVSEKTRQKLSVSQRNRDNSCYTPEVRQEMSKKAKEREARKKAEGYTVSEETRRKKSEASQKMWDARRPPKHLAKEFYLTLETNLPIKEKRKILYEQFPDVHQVSVCRWVREWHIEQNGTPPSLNNGKRLEYNLVHSFFLSLPAEMSMIKKRDSICCKFPDIPRCTIQHWTYQWHIEITGSPPPRESWNKGVKTGKPAHNRSPEYESAKDFFTSLPPDMPLSEKRKVFRERYSHVVKGVRNTWIRQWLSELEPTQQQPEFQF